MYSSPKMESIEVKGDGLRQYKDQKLTNIEVPFSAIICGASGSKKTNTLINIIKDVPAFQHYYVYAKNPDQGLFKFLKDKFQEVSDKLQISLSDIITVSNSVKDLPSDIKQFRPRSLIVFDDMQTETKKDKEKIANLFCNSRSHGQSCIWIGQSYFQVPIEIRDNCDYIFYKRVNSKKALDRMMNEYIVDDNEKKAVHGLLQACSKQ